MKDNLIKEKSYVFALKIIKIYKQLVCQNKEYVLARQLLRSGTSIGANVEEAIGGQSRKDFISKISIAYKESRETCYWIKLLTDSDFLGGDQSEDLLLDCNEIIRIIAAIKITIKKMDSNHS